MVDILASALLTTIAGATIAFVSIYLKEKINKIKLFKALYLEIQLNHESAKSNIELYDSVGEDSVLFNLQESAFQRIMMSGELYNLPPDIIANLDNAYSIIHQFNNKDFWDDPDIMCESIEDSLSHVIEELPKNLKFLRIRG